MRLLPALLFAAAASACAPKAASPGPPRSRLATATRPADFTGPGGRPLARRRATILYENRGRAFPLPLVTGTIAGQPALMLVDTGANSHIIAGWLARKLGLPMRRLGDSGSDHVGKSVPTFRIENPGVVIDRWGALAPAPILALDVPEVIERLGIGAFISPQRLVDAPAKGEDGDAIVLDLEKGEIRAAWWDDARYELTAEGIELVRGDESSRVCEEQSGPIKVLAYVVPASIESQRVSLLLDTGAQHSDLFASSAAGLKLAGQSVTNKEPMYTASGRVSTRIVKSARVTAGSFSVTTDVDLITGGPDAACPRDGVIAMDVLRSCTLLLGRSRVYGRCAAPSEARAPVR
ncbi:MAG: aspartyl protease family protein [Labilithrix sp.]|nr:aspartyl protease family protein [Labilithrix sp.]